VDSFLRDKDKQFVTVADKIYIGFTSLFTLLFLRLVFPSCAGLVILKYMYMYMYIYIYIYICVCVFSTKLDITVTVDLVTSLS